MITEQSEYFNSAKPVILKMPFGKYYFFEKFIVSEMFEGIHFDWDMAEKLITEVIKHYGVKAKLGFISNRINHFSVDPQNWMKLEKNTILLLHLPLLPMIIQIS